MLVLCVYLLLVDTQALGKLPLMTCACVYLFILMNDMFE